MRILLACAAFFQVVILLFLSCKKDIKGPSSDNQPPIAHAGSDFTITLASCNTIGSAVLDGSLSTDPDNNITSYSWRKIAGPQGEMITNYRSLTTYKAGVTNLSPGEYAFELSINDAKNLVSKDTVLISVKAPGAVEYNLDVTLNGFYSFNDNVEDCYYGPPCYYFDATSIEASGTFLPLGDLVDYWSEYSDTAASRYATESYITLQKRTGNDEYINGRSMVNLKRLIQQGGGPFSGTFTVTDGTAQGCTPSVFQDLPPLTITGSLNTITKKITITIKGKTYF